MWGLLRSLKLLSAPLNPLVPIPVTYHVTGIGTSEPTLRAMLLVIGMALGNADWDFHRCADKAPCVGQEKQLQVKDRSLLSLHYQFEHRVQECYIQT